MLNTENLLEVQTLPTMAEVNMHLIMFYFYFQLALMVILMHFEPFDCMQKVFYSPVLSLLKVVFLL